MAKTPEEVEDKQVVLIRKMVNGRVVNFGAVAKGLTLDDARQEAKRIIDGMVSASQRASDKEYHLTANNFFIDETKNRKD